MLFRGSRDGGDFACLPKYIPLYCPGVQGPALQDEGVGDHGCGEHPAGALQSRSTGRCESIALQFSEENS